MTQYVFFLFLKKYMLNSAYCVMVSNCAAAIGAYVLCADSVAHFLFFQEKIRLQIEEKTEATVK